MRAFRYVVPAALVLATLALPATGEAKTFKVTKTADSNDGHCNADCSLREAITAANATMPKDVVKLGKHIYKLTREGSDNDNSAGDLDVLSDLKITGVSPAKTKIQGAWATTPDGLIATAGIALQVSGLTLTKGNTESIGQGSAIHVDADSSLKLSDARVTRNPSGSSGAIANYGDATLAKVRIDHNKTGCCPGFYNNGGSTAKLTNVSFDHNTAADDTGAMYSDGDLATLRNVTFSDNHSGNVGGGALISSGGVLSLTNVTFDGNTTKGSGGGLYTESGSETDINNATFTRNVADSDDDAGGDGGGFYNASAGGTGVYIRNTILADNTDMGGEAPDCSQGSGNAFTSLGHNLLGPGPDGCTFTPTSGDVIGGEALAGLAPLASNGGFTQTVALKPASPAINHGSDIAPGSGGTACDKHDQRGVKRPQGKRCDIGAYELKPKR